MEGQNETPRRRRRPPQPVAAMEAPDAREAEAGTPGEPARPQRRRPAVSECAPAAPEDVVAERANDAPDNARSKVEFLAAGLGILYAVYLIRYFYGAWMSDDFTGMIAAQLATPHIVCAALGAALSFAAFLSNVRWLALAGAALYCAAAAVFPVYAAQMIPLIALGAWGCAILWRRAGKDGKK